MLTQNEYLDRTFIYTVGIELIDIIKIKWEKKLEKHVTRELCEMTSWKYSNHQRKFDCSINTLSLRNWSQAFLCRNQSSANEIRGKHKKRRLAVRGFDPRTSGLWAQHASTLLLAHAKHDTHTHTLFYMCCNITYDILFVWWPSLNSHSSFSHLQNCCRFEVTIGTLDKHTGSQNEVILCGSGFTW